MLTRFLSDSTGIGMGSHFHRVAHDHSRGRLQSALYELYAYVLLRAGPANQDSLVVIQMCYVGPKENDW